LALTNDPENSPMSEIPPAMEAAMSDATALETPTPEGDALPQPSYVKLAMRNMVRKRSTSLLHFALTAVGLLSILVGLAVLTR
jgi:hypothetical protein